MEAVITAVCDETCVNLNLLREKILRREYSRKHIKQIKPDIKKKVTGILPEKSELLPKIEAV
jgi:hypothetical protein